MASYTSTQAGDFNTDATWGGGGHPSSSGDTATIGHLVTAASNVVCGAITINSSGDLNTGTTAATITSITMAGTGACTIGTGGATLAGVLNNGGGLLTINGAITGCTTFTTGNANVYANMTISVGTTIAANKTLRIYSGIFATPDFPSSTSSTASLIMEAGTTLNFSGANFPNIGNITMNGTSSSKITVQNTSGGATATALYGIMNLTWCDFTKIAIYIIASVSKISNCSFSTNGISVHTSADPSKVIINNSYIYGGTRGISPAAGYFELNNCVFGYKRDGSASINSVADISADASAMHSVVLANNVILGSSTPVLLAVNKANEATINNYGHVIPSMLPGTGSALDLAQTTAGIGYHYNYVGLINRSSSNPPSGKTYHARLTPYPGISANFYLELDFSVPIISGDNLTVNAKASRSANTSDCADCQIDPEGAWFTPTTVAFDLTNTATYYSLPTCSATNAGGTGAKGMCRIVFRMKEYTAAQYLDLGDISVTVTHADLTSTKYTVDCQNWSNGMPTVDKPDYPLVANVKKPTSYNSGNKTGEFGGFIAVLAS